MSASEVSVVENVSAGRDVSKSADDGMFDSCTSDTVEVPGFFVEVYENTINKITSAGVAIAK
jgi:hypothetical protein